MYYLTGRCVLRGIFGAECLVVLAGALLLGISGSIVPETHTSFIRKSFKCPKKNDICLLSKREIIPFGLEGAHRIHQQEHLLLSLRAVASVQIMLQWHRSLHGADHVNVPLLYTTGDFKQTMWQRVGEDRNCLCHILSHDTMRGCLPVS